jgi:hypothetical protein
MSMRNIGPLNDGDDDPLGDEMKDKQSLTYRRRAAIDAVLRLIGCNHPRNVSCDCVDAVVGVGEAMVDSALTLAYAAIHGLPRPLQMRQVDEVLESIRVQTWISTSTERRNT